MCKQKPSDLMDECNDVKVPLTDQIGPNANTEDDLSPCRTGQEQTM